MSPLPACIRLTHPAEDFPVLEITHSSCRARVAMHGAQVMSWEPVGHAPVFYLSPCSVFRAGKAIRGGIPLCWPWFSAHPTDESKPAHGFVRNRFWELTSCEDDGASVALRFELVDSSETRALWNHAFHTVLELRLGSELHLSLISHNTGDCPFTCTGALHSYFAVSDVGAVEIEGLDGETFIEKASDQMIPGEQIGSVQVVGEIDRVYASTGDLVLQDTHRRIRISKHGSRSSVVWNPGPHKAAEIADLPPGDYRRFLCLEVANAQGAEVTLGPGETHILGCRVAVETSEGPRTSA